ncbi:MAG TPA: helix-turn-helix domain-containing protein [Gemmatimonadaceae bacterium]|nr:helix-turn-helix domain-containing protein [Gemmatimonadaceae bacterium]
MVTFPSRPSAGSGSASSASPHPRPHRVAVLALETVIPFDLGIPTQIFACGPPALARAPYTVRVCAPAAGRLRAAQGVVLDVRYGLRILAAAETIVVPGIDTLDQNIPPAVCAALRRAHARGARIVSICTGAFVLAAAGLLDGRPATTHWRYAGMLAARYPAVRLDPRVLYVDDGEILTSAGLAAGIDLCLHLVRRDLGAEAANAVARQMVVAPHRSGGQAQFVDVPVPEDAGSLEPTRSWALERLGDPLTIERLAEHARMSRRTFTRRFRGETGVSPLNWVVHHRVLLARRLLETTDAPVERVAARAGFGTALSLRLHFRREVGTSPLAYRRTFRAARAG